MHWWVFDEVCLHLGFVVTLNPDPWVLDVCSHSTSPLQRFTRVPRAGVRYVEESLPGSAGLASLLDQLALVRFLADKLPEAEAAARRMSELAAELFGPGERAAAAMCDLRLGTVLAGARRPDPVASSSSRVAPRLAHSPCTRGRARALCHFR